MAYTEDQLKAAARKALAAGDMAAVEDLHRMAMELRQTTPGHVGGISGAITQGVLFGAGDEYLAGLSSLLGVQPDGQGGANWFDYSKPMGERYDTALEAIRREQEQYNAANPGKATVAEIGGAIAAPVGAVGAGGSLAARAAKSMGVGGLLSSLYGFNAGEGGAENRMENAKTQGILGAAIGGAIPIVGAGVRGGINAAMASRATSKAAKNAPTTEQLRAVADRAYQAVDDLGVKVKPEAMRAAADDIIGAMRQGGLDEGLGSLTPQSARLAQILDEAGNTQTPSPFRDLEIVRRKAGVPAANMQVGTESKLGMEAISGLDDMIGNLTPGQVTAGDAKALGKAISDARSAWAKMSRSQTIDDAIEASQNYLSGEASGIRNQFARILRNPKLSRGFSEAEKAAMRKVVNGSIPEQLLQLASGGIGQLATMATGAGLGSMAGPVGAAIGAGLGAGTAALSRRAAEAISRGNAEAVRGLVANGGLAALPQVSQQSIGLLEAAARRATAAGQQ